MTIALICAASVVITALLIAGVAIWFMEKSDAEGNYD